VQTTGDLRSECIPNRGPSRSERKRFELAPPVARTPRGATREGFAGDRVERLHEYVDAGVDGFVVNLDHHDPGLEERVSRFAEEVVPLIRR
jgi:alkanesulfonate monooxygenase SsuD/methylene tetrahydromethanopterin reductase-like flavin-dependent oxidoreductase (luciferase family)